MFLIAVLRARFVNLRGVHFLLPLEAAVAVDAVALDESEGERLPSDPASDAVAEAGSAEYGDRWETSGDR